MITATGMTFSALTFREVALQFPATGLEYAYVGLATQAFPRLLTAGLGVAAYFGARPFHGAVGPLK